MRLLVTGGAGFIGSNLVRQLVLESDAAVLNADKLTYAGHPASVRAIEDHPRYRFERIDICDAPAVGRLFAEFRPDAVLHLAAESHVDRSIDGPAAFIQTNIVGTYTLLQAAREHWSALSEEAREGFRFLHVSTDEVYGSLGAAGLFSEQTCYNPNSPYSASKAAADHLARAWHHTYGLPVLITNCSNNYGPYQFPEKLIPLLVLNALAGRELPIYGRGENVRDWLYVEDHARALRLVLERGLPGETYNIGGYHERSNLQVARALCELLDELLPSSPQRPHARLLRFVADRPGHDLRYAIDAAKLQRTLGWLPQETFATGLRKTVQWYLAHQDWCSEVTAGRYQGERLGLRAQASRT